MSALQFPCTIFRTHKWMDDYGAEDMRCGDLSETQLKKYFSLTDVSARVNPYTLTKISAFNQPQSMFYGMHGEGERVSKLECCRILFDEFRHLSKPFAIYGPYRHLITEMITHMQRGNGVPFHSFYLNAALKEQILNDTSDNSSFHRLKKILDKEIDRENNHFPADKKILLTGIISGGKLPKFDRLQDRVNGMGITVHDTWATHITINSLDIYNGGYRAVVHYKIQDHFGLDNEDIRKIQFHELRFFRIWFVLQHYNQFGFRPFITEMEATVEIRG